MSRQVLVRWSSGIPGFGDARADGRYVVSQPGVCLVTDKGEIVQPDGQPARYLRVPFVGDRLACTWSSGGPDRAKEWTGTGWEDRGLSCGTNAVIYDFAGTLHVSHCELPQGSIGWRNVDPISGALVTCESTYADVAKGIFEWTAWPDIWIGQGTSGAVIWLPATRRLLRLSLHELRATGNLRNIRANREGDAFAITVVDYDQHLTTVTWATLAELRAMPVVATQPPPVPIPSPPPPIPKVTISSYLPKSGPAPLRVRAVAVITAGEANAKSFLWSSRPIGGKWSTPVAGNGLNPVTDPDHTFRFTRPGTFEIRVQVTDLTGKIADTTRAQRKVTVTR